MDKKTATVFIQQHAAENVSPEEQPRCIEVVETELMNPHARKKGAAESFCRSGIRIGAEREVKRSRTCQEDKQEH